MRHLIGEGTLVVLTVLSSTGTARAQSPPSQSDAAEVPQPRQSKPYDPIDQDGELANWDHLEFSMGFLGGQRHYDRTNFEWSDGGSTIEGARSLVKPFEAAPFDKLFVAGLRYDVRLVVSYMRMTAGLDIPFPIYRSRDAIGAYDVGGAQRIVALQSLQPIGLRFGIGGELPVGPVAPFVDILGAVHWTEAQLRIDDSDVTYKAQSFNLSTRAGARFHVRRWFFASVAGEIGIVGDVRWGAELAVGFAAM